MEQKSGGIAKFIFLGLAVVLLFQFGWPLIAGDGKAPAKQPFSESHSGSLPTGDRPAEELCELTSPRAAFALSSRGGALKSAKMLDASYEGIELVTTSTEQRMPLRTNLTVPGDANQQVDFDNLDFNVERGEASCTFTFQDDKTEIEKVVSLTGRPFELDVRLTVKNRSDVARQHRLTIEQTSWRTKAETEASFWDLGRRPPWLTDVATHTKSSTDRHLPGTFAPGEFEEEGFTSERWLRAPGDGIWAMIGTNYFASTIIHLEAASAPAAETLIEDGEYYGLKPSDPQFGHLYRARLAYEVKELGPGQEASYAALAFVGPKERGLLAGVGGAGESYGTAQMIDLGYFGAIGSILLGYTYWLFGLVKSWGWAICLLTLSVKLLVFPLQLPQLRTSVAMRRVKPQMDEITEKYKADLMQKNLALQELYRREGIRPLIGCLPLMLQMPVWFALYQALGTAVELYRTPFGPLIPDLTEADPYHVIPIVLGASSFLQQKMMPPQGMDPAQAKMMLFMMPAIFTVMMFFMPAGLGVYMLTNTWLGIGQQFLVERWIQSRTKTPATIEVREVKKAGVDAGTDAPAGAIEKGRLRARG